MTAQIAVEIHCRHEKLGHKTCETKTLFVLDFFTAHYSMRLIDLQGLAEKTFMADGWKRECGRWICPKHVEIMKDASDIQMKRPKKMKAVAA